MYEDLNEPVRDNMQKFTNQNAIIQKVFKCRIF